jgi:hypothetical protein
MIQLDLTVNRERGNERVCLARIVSRDVALQMADGLLMRRDDPVYEIADGDDARHLVPVHDGQVADAILRHQAHALVDGVSRCHSDNRADHDVPDQSMFRGAVFQDHLPRSHARK